MLPLVELISRLLFNSLLERLQKNKKNSQKVDSARFLNDDKSSVLIGHTIPSSRNRMQPEAIRLRFFHRLRHVMITGQTGSGKSVLARNLILADLLDKGNGLVAMDYTGDFFDLILQFLAERYPPEEWDALCQRLVLFDLRQTSSFGEPDEPIVGYNFLLEAGEDGYMTTAAFLEVLKQVWGEGVLGVQIKDDLLHILLALTLSPHHKPSLLDIELFLADEEFRRRVIVGITDPMVLRYCERLASVKDLDSRIAALSNKISPLLSSHKRLREVLTATEKSYSFTKHFAEVRNPIVLCCLASGETADSVAGIVAGMIVNALVKSLLRADRAVGEEPKNGVNVILEECQNYASAIAKPLGRLIREGRKFGGYCTLITQSPKSLPAEIQNLINDTVGTMCLLSQGPNNAETVAGWVNSDEMPKAVVRRLLMQAKPGETLLLRQGQPPCRMQATMAPYPNVSEDKVRALRRAVLEYWGTPSSDAACSAPVPLPAPPGPVTAPEDGETVETREVVDTPKRTRRKKTP